VNGVHLSKGCIHSVHQEERGRLLTLLVAVSFDVDDPITALREIFSTGLKT